MSLYFSVVISPLSSAISSQLFFCHLIHLLNFQFKLLFQFNNFYLIVHFLVPFLCWYSLYLPSLRSQCPLILWTYFPLFPWQYFIIIILKFLLCPIPGPSRIGFYCSSFFFFFLIWVPFSFVFAYFCISDQCSTLWMLHCRGSEAYWIFFFFLVGSSMTSCLQWTSKDFVFCFIMADLRRA